MVDRTFVYLIPDLLYFERVLAQDQVSNAHAPDVGTGCFKQSSNGIGGSIGLADAARLVFRGDANDSSVDSAVAILWLEVRCAKFKAFNFRDFHEIAVFKAEQSRAAATPDQYETARPF
jgi:hypothetical protein